MGVVPTNRSWLNNAPIVCTQMGGSLVDSQKHLKDRGLQELQGHIAIQVTEQHSITPSAC